MRCGVAGVLLSAVGVFCVFAARFLSCSVLFWRFFGFCVRFVCPLGVFGGFCSVVFRIWGFVYW